MENNNDQSTPANPKAFPVDSCDKLKKDIELYTSECFYDVTFKVISDLNDESKVFRCHKDILASYSKVFKTMLQGPFKEGKVDRDYEIILPDTSPEVFDLAMRFVYGGSTDFKNPELAAQVYLFANKWLMDKLMKAVERFLESTVQPKDVLNILEHLVDFDFVDFNHVCYNCHQVLEQFPLQVMSSKSWLETPEKVVENILELDYIGLSESMLFVQLLKWGRAQVKDEADLRPKIDKLLKLIRFSIMDSVEFSMLCSKPIPLTAEENIKIFRSIVENNAKLLPEGFCESKNPRCMEPVENYKWSTSKNTFCTVNEQTEPVVLTVAVDPPHYLNGLILHSLTKINEGHQVHLTCEVFSSKNPELCILSVTYNDIVRANCFGHLFGELFFPYPIFMKQGIFFRLVLTYKHTAELSSASFKVGENFSWNDRSEFNNVGEVRVLFATKDENPSTVIVDVCGLKLCKKNYENLSPSAFSNYLDWNSRGFFVKK